MAPLLSLHLILFSIITSLLLPPVHSQSSTCYWPNGNIAPDYQRCPGSSTCCLTGEACLSNRLCFGARYNIAYRGACTDRSWPEEACPRVCFDDELINTWANIRPCPGNSNQIMTCGASGWVTGFCESNMSTFLWASANVVVGQLGVGQDSGEGSVDEDEDENTPSSISTSSTTPSPTGSSITSPTSDSDFDANGSENDSQTIALGAGLGVGLGLPLLAVSIGLLVLWARRGKRAKGVDHTGSSGSGIHDQGQEPRFALGVSSHKHNPAQQMERVQSLRELEGEPAIGGGMGIGIPVRELQ